ncbi:hypothetical protein GCM10027597_08050 [Saccharopolyspora tripterygii]
MSLGLAVDDLEVGHYGTEDRERLASYLDNLALALRSHDSGRVVDGERVAADQRGSGRSCAHGLPGSW